MLIGVRVDIFLNTGIMYRYAISFLVKGVTRELKSIFYFGVEK